MISKPIVAATTLCVICAGPAAAQSAAQQAAAQKAAQAAAAVIMKADAELEQAVVARDAQRFLSFIAEITTFNGGAPNEIHGRDAVMKMWAPFFEPNGPTLTWEPTKAEVLGGGDIGYSIGNSVYRGIGPNKEPVESRAQYISVWRKQADGSWKIVFDVASTLP
jgi:ketosteroid isomerase-like protein